MKTLLLIFLFLLVSHYAFGQPSSYMTFAIRLYDGNEQPYDLQRFCDELEIQNLGGGFISPCDSIPVRFSHYDKSNGYFYIHVGAVYPPYIFALMNQTDTMTLIFPHQNSLVCDFLMIQNGFFLVDLDCVESVRRTFPMISGQTFCPMSDDYWEAAREAADGSVYKTRILEYRREQQ